MADGLDLLSAMFAQDYRPIEDPYGIAAQGVASALPYAVNPYGSTAGNFATVLGGALVSGLLGYQARKRTDERNLLQSRALMEALTQGVTPERRQELIEQSPRLAKPLAMLELQSAQRAREQQLAQQKMMQEYKYKSALQKQEDLGIPFTEALAIEEGRPAAGTVGETVSFGKRGEETLDKIRNTLQNKPVFKEYEMLQQNLASLSQSAFDETGISGVEYVMKAAKGLDPRSTVREGEFEMIAGSAGLAKQFTNYLKRAKGEGGLSLQQRAEILDLVKREYDSRLDQVQKRTEASTERAVRQLGIGTDDTQKVDRVKRDLLGGITLESGAEVINRNARIPNLDVPAGYNWAQAIDQMKNRTIDADTFVNQLRQEQAQTAQQQPAQEPSVFMAAVEQTRKDPTKVGQLEIQASRVKELMAKGEANWTPQEKAEALALLQFFGIGRR